jgi:heptosyltransferase II
MTQHKAEGARQKAQGTTSAVVVLAPNWLGDAVLALPAIADVRRAYPAARLAVAARRAVAGVFRLVPAVDEVVVLESDARWWRRSVFRADVESLRAYDLAIVLPNSFQSAWLVQRAGIAERWGYRTDVRARLLTRAVPRVRGGHQAEYYQRLTSALGIPAGSPAPAIELEDERRGGARALLAERGHPAGAMLAVFAPGAAYGRAKQWIPAHVATLIARLQRERSATCVLVGSAADRATGDEIRRALPAVERGDPGAGRLIDLIGHTSLEQLAGVLASADVCVCNDSGAMHLAAAVGTRVVATFGPTNEHATGPLAWPGARAEVLTHEVWCRPCMLRECPIDHRCMTGLTPGRVFEAIGP